MIRFETKRVPAGEEKASSEENSTAYQGSQDSRETGPASGRNIGMQVRKRNGDLEPVDLNKIVKAITRCSGGLTDVDPIRIATKTISGLYDGATTKELDQLSIQTAASMMAEEPEYSFLASQLLGTFIDKEVRNQEIHAFSQAIRTGYELGLVAGRTYEFIMENSRKLNDAVDHGRNELFQYFGLLEPWQCLFRR